MNDKKKKKKKIHYEYSGDGGEVAFAILGEEEVDQLRKYYEKEEFNGLDWLYLPGNLGTIFQSTSPLGCSINNCVENVELYETPKEDGFYLLFRNIDTVTMEFDFDIDADEKFDNKKFSADVAKIRLGNVIGGANYDVYYDLYYDGKQILDYDADMEYSDNGYYDITIFQVKDGMSQIIYDNGFCGEFLD